MTILAALAIALGPTQDEWVRRLVPETRVSLELPGELALQKPEETETPRHGEKEYEFAGVGYTVTVSVAQPDRKVRITGPILDVARDEMLRSLQRDATIKTKVVERSDVKIDSAPARRVTISMLIEQLDYRARFALVGDETRLVVVTVMRNPDDEEAEKDAARIDRSLRVGEPASTDR